MRAGHVWLASFLLFPLVGAPLLAHPSFRSFGLLSRAVLSGGIGMVLLSWTMTLSALAGARWGPIAVLAAALAAFALRWVLRGEKEGGEGIPRTPSARGERAVRAVAIGVAAISLLAALAATVAARATSPDLLFFWGPKAQQFAAARTIDAEFLRAPHLEYLHDYYPPLVTNVYAFGAMIAGRFPWGAATLTFPLLLAVTAVGLDGILRARAAAAPAAATTAMTVSAIALIGIHASVAGNAEPFLLFFEVLGIALLMTAGAGSHSHILLAGLLFAGAAASKVEGASFVAAAALLFVLLKHPASRPVGRTLLLLLGPTALALGSWFLFGVSRELFGGYRGYGGLTDSRLDLLPSIVSAVGASLWKAGYALPWLVPIAVLLFLPGKTRSALLPMGVAAALAVFLLFTYLTTKGDPRQLISWSAARVLSPVAALTALACFAARDSP